MHKKLQSEGKIYEIYVWLILLFQASFHKHNSRDLVTLSSYKWIEIKVSFSATVARESKARKWDITFMTDHTLKVGLKCSCDTVLLHVNRDRGQCLSRICASEQSAEVRFYVLLIIPFKQNSRSLETLSQGSQRDVVYLGWPIAPSYMSPNAAVRGGGFRFRGLRKCSCAHGAEINFGDLTPYLSYALSSYEWIKTIRSVSRPSHAPQSQEGMERKIWSEIKPNFPLSDPACTVQTILGERDPCIR